MVAAAVILPRRFDVCGIDDSKRLTPAAREEAAERIKARARYCIAVADVCEIDSHNILQASLLAMKRALDGLGIEPKGVLVDGNQPLRGLQYPCKTVVEGDGKYAQIAAASILAKTHRDALMRELAQKYPGYGFEHNFGYSTPEHYRALEELGPCALHRQSFAPIRWRLQPALALD